MTSVESWPDPRIGELTAERDQLRASLDTAIRERDEERQLHAESSARYHDAARRTCQSLADQLATAQRDLATARADLRLANMTIHTTRKDAVEQTVEAIAVALVDRCQCPCGCQHGDVAAEFVRSRAWLPAAAGEGK